MVEPLRIARDRYEDMKEKNSMPPVCFLYNLPVKQLTLRSVNMRQGNAVVHLENSVIYTGDRKYIFIHMKKHFIRVCVYYFFIHALYLRIGVSIIICIRVHHSAVFSKY